MLPAVCHMTTYVIFYLDDLIEKYNNLYKSGDPWFQEKLTISPESMGENYLKNKKK